MNRDQVITLFPSSRRKSCTNAAQVICKVVSEDPLGAYSLLEMTVAPQSSPPAHIHKWEQEVYYILEGELLIQEGERTFIATAGSCINVPQDILHTFKNLGAVSARLLVIITPAWYGKLFEEWASQ